MTTQVVDFTPSPTAPFTFRATLDGAEYTVEVRWNLFGQRWYISVFTLTGVRITTVPLIGSPLDYDISLVAGYFTTVMLYRQATSQIIVDPVAA